MSRRETCWLGVLWLMAPALCYGWGRLKLFLPRHEIGWTFYYPLSDRTSILKVLFCTLSTSKAVFMLIFWLGLGGVLFWMNRKGRILHD